MSPRFFLKVMDVQNKSHTFQSAENYPSATTTLRPVICATGTADEEMLMDSPDRNGWIHVQTEHDRAVLHLLSQVVYRQQEREEHDVAFDLPDPLDVAVILWQQGKAIGFYTIKPKGLTVEGTMETYVMNTVDTVFIRKAHRRRGHASSMLTHIISCFPDQDIAFSSPISHNMWQVLRKYLHKNSILRDKFWQVEGTGNEGDRKLIWYCLKKLPHT